MLLELSGFLLFLCVVYLLRLQKRPKNFPPGPFSWPLIGNLAQVGLESHKGVMNLKKNYGDIIGIDLGAKRAVYINECGLIREAFNIPALCGRPPFHHFAEPISGEFRGLVFTSGKTWIEQRNFAFSYIKSGYRNGVQFESLILNETKELIENIKMISGKPTSTRVVFSINAINSLWSIVAGERYSIEDKTFLQMTQHVYELATAVATQGALVFFPKLRKWLPKLSGYEHFLANAKPVHAFMQNIIDSHKETYQEGIQRDLVDSYLQKMNSTTDINSPFFGKVGVENLNHTLHDVFIAGTEPTSTTLRWIVFLMAHHPSIQEKLCRVISKYMEKRELPSSKDRLELPYVEAVINEALRYSAVVPLGVFHGATEDVELHGFLIPKGTMVIANQYAVLHDSEVWGDPENFRPQRFLTNDESAIIRHSAFIPFSEGRRNCPGQSLARDVLFLFTIQLFQHFKVEFDPNEPIPELKYIFGTVLSPAYHKVVFQRRE